MHEKLLETRRQWYAAYIEGNVGQLDHIESDDFVLINEAGLQGKLDQLGNIAEAVAAGQWFARGSRAEDVTLRVLPLDDVVSIYGQGRIAEHDRSRPWLHFSELWCKENGEWRVLTLHFTTASAAA
ncbi:MAG: nuclear transport factor 2 family protein [Halomonas sp.]|uniref:nuclear transport factor 2 family protein n=1 Tax=Halomonadaceae TaxID=28256 RepID=UPI00135BFC66|nr:nuclear transport factor 2 family protein [Halomonas tianxiuensis]MCE8033193.1 nuclear transport factor 2 family protein [Halomonas sp. MCCC 1A11057]MDX5434698.1 nuclear transport factor 2 family protein [Halomonas sp.]